MIRRLRQRLSSLFEKAELEVSNYSDSSTITLDEDTAYWQTVIASLREGHVLTPDETAPQLPNWISRPGTERK